LQAARKIEDAIVSIEMHSDGTGNAHPTFYLLALTVDLLKEVNYGDTEHYLEPIA
jgi:hypothetical protein